VTPDTNAYFTYSSGFKSGTFNSSTIPYTPSGAVPPAVRPEHVDAFEIGVKSEPANWLRLDAALFWYDYTNQQLNADQTICQPLPGGGQSCAPLAIFENAGASIIKGAEFDVDAKVTPAFRVRGGLSLLNARFNNFPNAQVNVAAPGNAGTMILDPAGTNISGRALPRAPDETVTLSGTYTTQVGPGTLSLTGNFYASSRLYYDVGDIFSQGPYATLGLNATFVPDDMPNLSLSLWGKNITSTTVILGTFITTNAVGISYAPPATYGITVGYDF
jgi:iron complex outermembrane receptor protein